MYPILARYGPFFLHSYTLLLALGIALTLALTAWLARRNPLPHWLDGVLFAAAAALAGGRLTYVLVHLDYFRENTAETWQLWRGGLSYHGVLIAGLFALWLWSRRQNSPFSAYAALLSPAMALLSAAGWAACWFEGCGYGAQTTPGLLSASLPDDFGVFAVRYQTQLIGFALSLLLLPFLLWLRNRRTAAWQFWFALLTLSTIHGIVGLLRGDPMPQFLNWRVDVWLDFTLALFALIALLSSARNTRINNSRYTLIC